MSQLIININELRPLIKVVIRETIAELDGRGEGRIAYSEREGAELLGVAPHVLRDARLRGEIHARKLGREYRYSRFELARFLGEKRSGEQL